MQVFKDAAIRAIRTYLQVFIGLLLAGWAGNVVDLHTGLSILQTAAVGAIPAVLSLIQNMLEQYGTPVDYPRG